MDVFSFENAPMSLLFHLLPMHGAGHRDDEDYHP